MRRVGHNFGSKTEVLAELEELGRQAAKKGKVAKATEYARAVRQIEEEHDTYVEVHGQTYVVEDG